MESKTGESKTRKPRRTQAVLENDIMKAISEAVVENGFENVTLIDILKRCDTTIAVVHRRYGSLERMLEAFVRKHEYWLADLINPIVKRNSPIEEHFRGVLDKIISEIYRNKELQRILAWETTPNNAIMRKSAKRRDADLVKIIENISEHTIEEEIDFEAISAIMIGSIFYLTSRKGVSPFCGINFNSNEGKQRLYDGIYWLNSLVFAEINRQKELQQIAESLKASRVSSDIIFKATGIEI